jgi:2-oxoglutarate/2-oxoacid ferredoxin oxidoreductase subunit beta
MPSLSMKDLQGRDAPTWCPGCGDHGVLSAMKLAMIALDLHPHQLLIVTGIGCGSKLPSYLKVNGFHTLHGRDIAFATGAQLSRSDMPILTVSGDGNTYGMGLSHLLHAARRNVNLTSIVQNNQVYGLTKGQYSPTTAPGTVSKTSPAPAGAIEQPVQPLALALVAGATFIARGFAKDPRHLSELIVKAIQHRGYALIDVLQPCVTFNRVNTYDWHSERVYKVEEQEGGYDPGDKAAALEKTMEWGDRIPLGILYQVEQPTYDDQVPALKAGSLVAQGVHHDRANLERIKQEFI